MSNAVPTGWETKKISDIATVFSGGTPDRTNPDFYKGKNPWVKSGEINSRIIRNTEERISDAAIEQSSAKWVPNGAVLVAMYGATAGKVAKLMIDATLNQAISAVIVKGDSSHNDYLFHSLDFNSEELLKSLQGSGQPNLSGGLIKGLKILHPPLPEQQKIAAILTAVDDVIESTQAQINKLKDLKTGMMQELLSKGIGHTEFKDSPVGRIPAGWEVMPVAALQKPGKYNCVGGPFGSDLTSKDYIEFSGVPVIRGTNLPSGFEKFRDFGFVYLTDDKAESLLKNMAYPGDLVFTQRGTMGQVGLIPKDSKFKRYVVSQSQMKLTPNSAIADSEYLYQFFTSSQFLRQLEMETIATGLPHINLGILKAFNIPIPSMNEQMRISAILASFDMRLSAIMKKLEQFQDTKKALMQDLLTGKVRVKTV